MTWYPDWVVALDDTAKDKPNANVTPPKQPTEDGA